MSSNIFGLQRTRAVQAIRSKKAKKSKKKGSNKLSKKSKKGKGKGGGSSSSDSDDLPDGPTAAPTCLECDDLRSEESAFFARGGNLSSRSDSAQRVVFAGIFFVLLIGFWILLLLHRSSRQRRQRQLQKSVGYLNDKPDDATHVEDDWAVVID
jgi:hypothetical protein